MEDNRLIFFQNTLDALNLRTVVIKKDGSNLDQIDSRFRAKLYEQNFLRGPFRLPDGTDSETALFRHTDEFLLSYFLLRVPATYLTEEDTPWVTVGPFCESRPGPEDVNRIMEKNGIPQRLRREVSAFYDTLPVTDSAASYEQLVCRLASGLFGRTYHPEYLPANCVLFLNESQILRTVRDNPQIAMDTIAQRYLAENEMMAAIAAGDYPKARLYRGRFLTYHVRPRAADPLRNEQHFAIILNTLCRKAAEEGGVHPLYIDELSTRFAVLINELRSIGDITALTGEMVHKYCLLVKNHAMKGCSPVVKEVVSYIDFHYREELCLDSLARRFNVSKTYLSNLVRRETGVTLTDFIHQVRMRKALTLINSSALPVTALAAECGYNDLNYFIRIFKRTYGLSPGQYQKRFTRTGDERAGLALQPPDQTISENS